MKRQTANLSFSYSIISVCPGTPRQTCARWCMSKRERTRPSFLHTVLISSMQIRATSFVHIRGSHYTAYFFLNSPLLSHRLVVLVSKLTIALPPPCRSGAVLVSRQSVWDAFGARIAPDQMSLRTPSWTLRQSAIRIMPSR